ncbi:MAG TPA: hypothetical protein VGR72_00600 [Candidatus Acidoferrales bacterium]|nr:hypothetical protein [Candidatus Acidoferrales bacterium]
MLSSTLWIIGSLMVAELLGYWLHRLLHSDRVRVLSRSHMIHHLLLYGPLQPQRPGSDYLDATTGKVALGNIGLEWLVPSGLLLTLSLALLWTMRVTVTHQLIFASVTLTWSFLMFGYLHDQMHVEGFWMARNALLGRWFRSARQLHDIHHVSLNNTGLMDKNFGIGFYFFDRVFRTLSEAEQPFNETGYEAAKKRYAFLQEQSPET